MPLSVAMQFQAGPPLYDIITPNEQGQPNLRMLCISSMMSLPTEKSPLSAMNA
jgi:hypothetical protein